MTRPCTFQRAQCDALAVYRLLARLNRGPSQAVGQGSPLGRPFVPRATRAVVNDTTRIPFYGHRLWIRIVPVRISLCTDQRTVRFPAMQV